MSIDIRNDIISNSNADIMEYLIQKLESRKRNLSKYANIFNSIDSFESFYQRRKDIFLLFKNMEEELHQASLAIKALIVQNKALSQESTSTINFQKNYNKLLQENNYLLKENNNYAKQLNELNNKNRSPKRAVSPSFTPKLKHKYNFNNKNENLNNNNFEKRLNYSKNINTNKNKVKKKENNNGDILNYDLDLNDIGQLKNVKNIMKDMKRNKNKLKEVIDQHFGRNQIEGNRNNIYLKND